MKRVIIKAISMILLCTYVGCGELESSEVSYEGQTANDESVNTVNGSDGKDGAAGPQGETGAPGQFVVLVDQDDTEIGYFLDRVDFDANTFEILTVDGYKTVLDLDDGSFTPPDEMASGFGFSCMYESADCSGECYGAEPRSRGYILNGQSGSLHYVEINANTVAITSNSHNVNTALGTCVASTIALSDAVPTQSYSGVLSEGINAPIELRIKN